MQTDENLQPPTPEDVELSAAKSTNKSTQRVGISHNSRRSKSAAKGRTEVSAETPAEVSVETSSADATQTPEDVEPAAAKVGNKPTRRVGIGHNSRRSKVTEDEMAEVSPEIFSAEASETEAAIMAFDKVMTESSATRRKATNTTLPVVYAFISKLYETGTDGRFRELHGISACGRSGNDVQPLVAWNFRNLERKYVRQTVWRWSAASAYGRAMKYEPAKFRDELIASGLENLVNQYLYMKSGNAASNPSAERKLAESILKDSDSVPIFPTTDITRGEPGLKIAVLRVRADGFKVVAILEDFPEKVVRRLAGIARRRRAANE